MWARLQGRLPDGGFCKVGCELCVCTLSWCALYQCTLYIWLYKTLRVEATHHSASSSASCPSPSGRRSADDSVLARAERSSRQTGHLRPEPCMRSHWVRQPAQRTRGGSEKRQGWAPATDGCTDHCRRCARTASPPFPPAARGSTHTRASSAPPHLSTARCVSGREAACGSRGASGTRAVPASRQPTLGQSARQSCAVECC